MRSFRKWALLLSTLAFSSLSCAQDVFPSKPIRIIVPFAPTGIPDVLARMVAQKVSADIGQQLIVENRPGASSVIGTGAAAKAPPDGYTLLVSGTASNAITPALAGTLPYHPVRDFSAITEAASGPLYLVANPASGIRSVKDLVAAAKARPGTINYASTGDKSLHFWAMEQFKLMAQLDLVHVPYKGVIQATPALLTGEVSVMISTLAPVLSHIKAGKLRILAVTRSQRWSGMPDASTFAEQGLPDVDIATSLGFVAPAGTPGAIINWLNSTFVRALKTPEVKAAMLRFDKEVIAGTPESYAATMAKEYAHYVALVQTLKLPN